VREHIFKPANMRDTDWYETDFATPNLASGYTNEMSKGRGDLVRKSNVYTRPARGSSAGGGYSTAPDLLKFVLALREGKLRIPTSASRQRRVSKLPLNKSAPGLGDSALQAALQGSMRRWKLMKIAVTRSSCYRIMIHRALRT
jgi:CubicO group peptidase (beta-lactamase class C family)